MKNFCKDCSKEIGPYAKRCGSCSATLRNLSGKGNYKGGKTLNRICPVCGIAVSKQATKCRPCAKIALVERMTKLAESRKGVPLIQQSEKECRTCKKILPVTEFYKHKLQYQSDCKECCKQIHKEYVESHREQINKYNIEYNHKVRKSIFYHQGKRKTNNEPSKYIPLKYISTWYKIKQMIFERDNYICQECGKSKDEYKILHCHHIDYNTGNNLSINLISLCPACHSRTNHQRTIWQKYYEDKML